MTQHRRHNHLPERNDPRGELGLRPVINVSGTMTALGASIIVPEAIDAMTRIAPEFVDMTDMQRKASPHIARLTGAEAGTVTACCSAGITMATAIASAYSQRSVRDDLAMTGELTLTGMVLPVGGIKEKLLAAHRAGMRQVLLPTDNEAELAKLPDNVRGDLSITLVSDLQEVLGHAFSR